MIIDEIIELEQSLDHLFTSLCPAHTDRFFIVDKKLEWKSFCVHWPLVQLKIGPSFATICLQ